MSRKLTSGVPHPEAAHVVAVGEQPLVRDPVVDADRPVAVQEERQPLRQRVVGALHRVEPLDHQVVGGCERIDVDGCSRSGAWECSSRGVGTVLRNQSTSSPCPRPVQYARCSAVGPKPARQNSRSTCAALSGSVTGVGPGGEPCSIGAIGGVAPPEAGGTPGGPATGGRSRDLDAHGARQQPAAAVRVDAAHGVAIRPAGPDLRVRERPVRRTADQPAVAQHLIDVRAASPSVPPSAA